MIKPARLLLGAIMLSTLLSGLFSSAPAAALSGSDFHPERIIDDSLFYNKSTMSVQQIQTFLNNQVPTCDTNGTKVYSGTTLRKNVDSRYPPPYTCLKDYYENTTTHATNYGGVAIPSGAISAAQIIYNAAQDYSINPQVLIVLIQKESSLVTDDWPWTNEYRSATGYGCPDTAACDSTYYGFYNQVHNAARQFRLYANNPNSYNYVAGVPVNVLYNPNAACGTLRLTITNQATAGLYDYTPYTPNQAALNNLYGSGDNCSSYGNRNFWRLFNDWFGPTSGAFLGQTAGSNTPWLISEGKRYPITDTSYLPIYIANFGAVKPVDPTYLNSMTQMPSAPRYARSPSTGAIYLLDTYGRSLFATCDQLAAFGGDCNNTLTMDDTSLSYFLNRGAITSLIRDNAGRMYVVQADRKRFIPDPDTFAALGYTGQPYMQLGDTTVNSLPDGVPMLRTNVLFYDPSGNTWLYDGTNKRLLTDSGLVADYGMTSYAKYNLAGWQADGITTGQPLTPWITDANGTKYVLDGGQKHPLGSNAAQWAASFTSLNSDIVAAIPTGGAVGTLVRRASDGVIFSIESGRHLAIPTVADFNNAGFTTANVVTMNAITIDRLLPGPYRFGTGRLIRLGNTPEVRVVNGSGSMTIPSMTIFSSYGYSMSNVWSVDPATFSTYPVSGSLLTTVTNGSSNYVIDNGFARPIDGATASAYGVSSFQSVSTNLISSLAQGGYMTTYIKGAGPATYAVSGGQKHLFRSYSGYLAACNNQTNLTITVSDAIITGLPNGSDIP